MKRNRIDAWIEENREAMDAHAEDIRKNGMWSDGLRPFKVKRCAVCKLKGQTGLFAAIHYPA